MWKRIAMLILVATTVVSACGSDDDADSSSSSSTTAASGASTTTSSGTDASTSAPASESLIIQLAGGNEAPGPGDTDGRGIAKVTINKNTEVCVELSVTDVDLPATAAHIHEGPKASAGPIVVTLPTPDETGRSSGCVSIQGNVQASGLSLARGKDYYVNVHTKAFPNGAVRGQLA
jgi:hypothetical protein